MGTIILKKVYLTCDTNNCIKRFGPLTNMPIKHLRELAKEKGWGVSGNEDRCPQHRNLRMSSAKEV